MPDQARRTRAEPICRTGATIEEGAVIALLKRPDGAAISDLIGVTGWQVHSVRAALTGLRKEGKDLVRAKDATGVTHYRLANQA